MKKILITLALIVSFSAQSHTRPRKLTNEISRIFGITTSTVPCTFTSCRQFYNSDYQQIYAAYIAAAGMSYTDVPCTFSSCRQFYNSDLGQIYAAITSNSFTPSAYVPYTGAISDLNLGVYNYYGNDYYVNGQLNVDGQCILNNSVTVNSNLKVIGAITSPTIYGSNSANGDLYLQSNSTSTVGEIYMKDQTFIYNKLNIGETGGTEGMIRWYGAAATTTNNILWETGIDVANSPVKTDLVLAAKVYSNGGVADLIYCKYNGTLQPVVSIPVDATETVATLALGIYGSNLQYDILKMTTRTGQTGKAIRVQNDALIDKFTVDRDGNNVALSYSAGVTGGTGKFYANDPASYAPEYQMLASGTRKWTTTMNAAFGMNFIDATGTVRFVLGQDGRLTAGNAADNGSGYIQGGLYGIVGTVVINGSRELVNITKITAEGSVLQKQGTDVASANSMTLGTGGNSFEITGTTQINLLNSSNWQNGATVRLMFTSNPTIKNGQATSSTNITMLLNGGVDFVASSNDVLTLMLGEIGGVVAWREVSRSVN